MASNTSANNGQSDWHLVGGIQRISLPSIFSASAQDSEALMKSGAAHNMAPNSSSSSSSSATSNNKSNIQYGGGTGATTEGGGAGGKFDLLNPRTWTFDTMCIPVSVVLGIFVGALVPGNSDLSPKYRPVSSILGWSYFFCWSISFYPQIWQNYRRQTTVGFATDKILLDLLGYSCLSAYCIGLYGIPSVREMYQDRNKGNSPKVAINDVCFGLHGLLMTFIQIGQIVYYDGKKQMPTKYCQVGVATATFLVLGYLILIVSGASDSGVFNLLDWFYFISFVKIGITCLKYIPQVMSNHKRKCTVGWSITSVLMDILGSVLSALQLFLDCDDTNDWSGITGNFVKFALSFVSLIFDAIFMTQHYVLYPLPANYHTLPLLSKEELQIEDSKGDDDHFQYIH
jgi:cystinosin